MTTKKVKRERSTSTAGQYVTNAQLLPEIAACKANGNKLSPTLARYLHMIAEKYSFSHSWAGYSYREDMVAFALVNLIANWHKFDPERTDQAFSYYTQACYHSFVQFHGDEKKQRNIRDSLLIEAGANPSFSFQDKSNVGTMSDDSSFGGGRFED